MKAFRGLKRKGICCPDLTVQYSGVYYNDRILTVVCFPRLLTLIDTVEVRYIEYRRAERLFADSSLLLGTE